MDDAQPSPGPAPGPAPGIAERARSAAPDIVAALVVFLLGIPQCLAYATIAGLPPAMGLYAATVPAIVGSLVRSSNHVVVGPTNALSLLVGGAVVAVTAAGNPGVDPFAVAIALALGVGLFQLAATALRLSSVVDYISSPTVLGYITGAGVLIGIGQLHNLTATTGEGGRMWVTVASWIAALPETHSLSLIFSAATVLAVIAIRLLGKALDRKLPAALIVMILGIVANVVLGLEDRGLRVIADIEPIPRGLPPLTLPNLDLALELAPFAVACGVLSLVEANAVARSIAGRTGQRLDPRREFLGQGLANLSAALFGGYPVSGSLSRSALNEQAGAKTRASGVLTGVLMLLVLVSAASVLDHTPIPSLAGLLLVIAWDLVDVPRIRKTLRTSRGDGLTFLVTMVATWSMDLDAAIYLGVGLSVVLFLRQARLLTISELVVNPHGYLHEHPLGAPLGEHRRCSAIRLIHVEGSLFFGSAGELSRALEALARDLEVKVIIVRLKHASGLDLTAAEALATVAEAMRERDQHLLLVGMTPDVMPVLERSGVAESVGEEQLFPARAQWFAALEAARERAFELVGAHTEDCGLDNARPFVLTDDGVAD